MGYNEEMCSDALLGLIAVGVISILCFIGAFYCYDWIFGELFTAIFVAGGLFSAILCVGCVAGFIHERRDMQELNEKHKRFDLLLQSLPEGQRYYYGHNTIGLSVKKGYCKYEIKGSKYRNVGLRDIGKFEGYAKTEPENPKDNFAVAIYREDGKHLGYIPKQQYIVFHEIQGEGGYVHAYGYIQAVCQEQFIGCVCIETFERQRLKLPRNKPYKTADKFYDSEEGHLTKFLDSKQQALFAGRLVYDKDGKMWQVEADYGVEIKCKNLIIDGNEDETDDITTRSFKPDELFRSARDISDFDAQTWLEKQYPSKRPKQK